MRLALAIAAGFPPERMLLHGNVKTDDELRLALDVGVGRIVLDSVDDIDRLGALARRQQRVMVRLTPAVDGQTHLALATGVEDQKFGVPIDQIETVRRVNAYPHLRLVGLHCHIGSQITKVSHYELAAVRMVEAMGKLHRRWARCSRSSISAAGMPWPTGKASHIWISTPSRSGCRPPSRSPARSRTFPCRG